MIVIVVLRGWNIVRIRSIRVALRGVILLIGAIRGLGVWPVRSWAIAIIGRIQVLVVRLSSYIWTWR